MIPFRAAGLGRKQGVGHVSVAMSTLKSII